MLTSWRNTAGKRPVDPWKFYNYFRTTWLAVSAPEALLGWWKRTCQLHKCAGLQCVTNRTTESLMLWSDGHPFGVKFPISRQWFLELCGSFDAIQIEYRICSCEKLGAITQKSCVCWFLLENMMIHRWIWGILSIHCYINHHKPIYFHTVYKNNAYNLTHRLT